MRKTTFLLAVVLLFSLDIRSNIINAETPVTTALDGAPRYRFDYEFSETAEGWLKLHAVPGTWRDAMLRCKAEGAVLASPLTNRLKQGIIEFASNKMAKTFESAKWIYIGVHATFSQGDYNSIEGVPLERLPVTWWVGEPNNLNDSESCLMLDTDTGDVADINCNHVFPFVCYTFKNETLQNECGTTDPEYHLHEATGSCYKLHKSSKTWSGAFRTCNGEGAHLAILNSKQEAQYLGRLIKGTWAHIGFHDWGSYGSFWMTINGKTLAEAGYGKWKAGEPNNVTYPSMGGVGEFCGSMDDNGELNDTPCHISYYFLCELTPGSLLPNQVY